MGPAIRSQWRQLPPWKPIGPVSTLLEPRAGDLRTNELVEQALEPPAFSPHSASVAKSVATMLAEDDTSYLRSLSFDVMHDRGDAIDDGDAATFYWIFQSQRHDTRLWDNITRDLR